MVEDAMSSLVEPPKDDYLMNYLTDLSKESFSANAENISIDVSSTKNVLDVNPRTCCNSIHEHL